MNLHGVHENILDDAPSLVASLNADSIERFTAVPRTVMINPLDRAAPWLIVDATYPDQIRQRLALMKDKPDWVVARLEGDDVRASEIELRDSVVEYLVSSHPGYFSREGDMVLSRLTRMAVDIGPHGADPMVAVGVLATEDFLMMLPAGTDAKGHTIYPLKSGVLAFPNGWSLTSKFNRKEPPARHIHKHAEWVAARDESLKEARLGKTTYEIHNGIVRHFMENYATRVDMFFTRMPAGERYWRRNWSPNNSAQLFCHADTPSPDFPDELDNAYWEKNGYLRSEHETFVKLARSHAVAFGIKTFNWNLADILASPVARGALTEAFNNMEKNPAMFEYREHVLPSFGAYLRHVNPAMAPYGSGQSPS